MDVSAPRRVFLPALVMASFSSGPIAVLAALLLVDISNTFSTSVGITGQINTTYSIAAFIFALITAILSVKMKHKSLLLTGLLLETISTLGCFFASNFQTLLAFYSLSGAGYAIVNPMTLTLVGEYIPLEKRTRSIGWIGAGGASVYVIGAPIIAFMSGFGGWRLPLLAFVLPILLATALLAFLGLPNKPNNSEPSPTTSVDAHLNFREILSNKSAVACLVGDALRAAAFVAIVLYAVSFFRQRYLMPTNFASLILLGGAASYVVGSLSAGRFVKRYERKPSTAITALVSGVFTVSYVLVPNLMLSLPVFLLACWFSGLLASSANSLTLEQVPRLRGTMMSMDTAVLNVGAALGTVVGGLALIYFDYEGLGIILGVVGIAAATVFYALAKDPTKD